jgi:MYXO-CTERM domain-containing protein
MRKSIAALGLATALTLGGGASVTMAQSNDGAVAQTDADSNDDSDNTGLWGLLGLLGLAGLAGLKRRDDHHYRETGASTSSHR